MDDVHDDALIQEFVVESRDHLEALEPDLLALEEEGENVSPETINRVFRAMHSIKGASGFLGFDALTELSHLMENVLMKFRDGHLVPTPETIDPILAGFDKVCLMIENIHSSHDINYSDEQKKLNDILNPASDDTKNSGPERIIEEHTQSHPGNSHDSSIINEFIQESNDRLSRLDFDILPLKKGTLSLPQPSIKRICYTLMLLSNGSKFLDIVPLRELCEPLRTLFSKVRKNELTLDKELSENVLDIFNLLKEMIKKFPSLSEVDYTNEVTILNFFMGNDIQNESSKSTPDIEDKKIIQSETVEPVSKSKEENIRSEPKDSVTQIRPEKSTLSTSNRPVLNINDSKQKDEVSPPKQSTASETLRINVDLIDRMMNLAGELVLGRNQLRQEFENTDSKNSKLGNIIQNVDIVTSELQEDIMKMRMQPVGNLLNKFTRIVRDLSRQLSKEIKLTIEGKEVELDRTIIQGLSDPLTHLIRNSLDHGIESPAKREKTGKSRHGKLLIKTFHEGGQVNILVIDDGEGIDPDKVVEKAVAGGIISPEKVKTMPINEKINLILLPGMSTAEQVTDISGRGVGMDVVKTNIAKLGGHLDIDSCPGKGTTVRIRLPLTLAIIPSLILGIDDLRFAIPQINVQELFLIKAEEISEKIERIGDADVLRLRERLLPLVSLAKVLGLKQMIRASRSQQKIADQRKQLSDRRIIPTESENEIELQADIEYDRRKREDRRKSHTNDINVVVLKIGTNNFGLIVDQLFDNEEIVVKPLSTHIKDCKCFAGATIMGDGRVAMILDALGISELSRLNFSEIGAEESRRREDEKRSKAIDEYRESILLFNNAFNEHFALPLDNISRLEMINADSIYKIGDRRFVDYRNEGLPLYYLENLLPVSPFPDKLNDFFLIIPKAKGHSIGIVVSRILDTVETEMNIRQDNTTPHGLIGTAIIEGNLTMFLNTDELIQMVYNQTTDIPH